MSKSDDGKSKTPDRRSKAVALRYKVDEDASPVVVASGYGNIADKIIGIAEEKGIPVFRDDSAASMLCMLEVGRNVPPELYEVIAAIYMQIMQMAQKVKSDRSQPAGQLSRAEELRRQVLDSAKGK